MVQQINLWFGISEIYDTQAWTIVYDSIIFKIIIKTYPKKITSQKNYLIKNKQKYFVNIISVLKTTNF